MTKSQHCRIEPAFLLACAVLGLLAGCAAGPDFSPPAPPNMRSYSPGPLALETASASGPAGAAQRFTPGADVDAQWWRLFQNAELNAFMDRALTASPTLEVAQAALRAAQEGVRAQQGLFAPAVQAGYAATRAKQGGAGAGDAGGGIYNLHTAQLTVGYVPDVFGSNRRQVESLQAQSDVQHFQLRAAYVTLTTNIAIAAIQDAQLREQIRIVQLIVGAGESGAELVRRQLKAGYVSRLDLSLQESALAQTRQLLPPLKKQFEQNRNQLRTLAGGSPEMEVPEFQLAELRLPRELPVSLPAQVVEQRPDVRAAQEQLHAATAQVGVARAARLPQFTLNGSLGGAAAQIAQLSSGGFFSLAAAVVQPVFDGGTLRHRELGARESLNQATAQYQAVIMTALQNVADTLHAIYADAEALQAATQQAASARIALELTQRQYGHGYLDRIALIGAEQSDRQAQLAVVQAAGARLSDSAALFQALGGGWWNVQSAKVDGKAAQE